MNTRDAERVATKTATTTLNAVSLADLQQHADLLGIELTTEELELSYEVVTNLLITVPRNIRDMLEMVDGIESVATDTINIIRDAAPRED